MKNEELKKEIDRILNIGDEEEYMEVYYGKET